MDVFDFITIDNLVQNPFHNATYLLPLDQLIELNKIKSHNDTYSKISIINMGDRSFILSIPNLITSQMPLLIYFHGLGEHAMDSALNTTNWRKYNCIVAYGIGTSCGSNSDLRAGFNVKNPIDDIQYTLDIIKTVNNLYNINQTKIYFIGFSNGAIFSSIIAQKIGNTIFNKIVNIMGGFGKNAFEIKLYNEYHPLPILFITGTNDDYKESCEYAYNYFKTHHYDTEIKILNNIGHEYPINEEPFIWLFLT
jgi:predicted esterase